MTNELLLNVEEKMQYNCMIFTPKAYKDYLTISLNDKEFISSISSISLTNKLNDIEEIEKNLGIDLSYGKEFLKGLINEQSSIDILDSFEQQISNLYQTFRNDRSGEAFDKTRIEVEGIEDSLLDLKEEAKSEEAKGKISLLEEKIANIKKELNTILQTFMTDERYEYLINNLFDQNRIWQGKYGNYNFNPFLNKNKGIEDSSITYKEFIKCSYLPKIKYEPLSNRVFSPLVMDGSLYISKDAKSITCIDSNKQEEYTIKLDEEIMESGAIMYLKGEHFIIVPCKNYVYVLNKKGIAYKMPYNFSITDGLIIKSITVFNNLAYINISNYIDNTSIVFVLSFDFYRKEFTSRPAIYFKDRILSNIFILHDYEKEEFFSGYILNNQELCIADMNSLDKISSFKLDMLPIDDGFKMEKNNQVFEFKYYRPITVFEDKIYYTSLAKNNELYLCIINPFKEEESKILLPKYQKQNKNGIIPSFTNLCISLNKAYLCGNIDSEICEINLTTKNPIINQIPISKPRVNDFSIGYANALYTINEGNNPKRYNRFTLLGLWLGHFIVKESKEDGYILYLEA